MAVVMSSGWRLWFDDNMMPKDGYSQCLYDILCEFDLNLKNKEINSHLVRTNAQFGITEENAKCVIDMIN
jgi:hypothetical protein